MPDITPYIDSEQLAALRDSKPKGKRPLLSFWVGGNPIPKGRPRVVNGQAYTPKRTKDWEHTIAQYANIAMMRRSMDMLLEPIVIEIVFLYGNGRADLDNLIKAVLDALNGVVWQDDVQVMALTARIERGTPKQERGVLIHLNLFDNA